MSSQRVPWEELTSYSETYTCYSAAVATWVAWADESWSATVNPGLWLTLTDGPEGLFGFAHFPPGLRQALGLVRAGSEGADPAQAVEGVLEELGASGRVIVAGDGFNLPWHVAFGRRHVPHWFMLADAEDGPVIVDPFACRNELGLQTASRRPAPREQLPELLPALAGEDPVHRLRESLALGDEAGAPDGWPYQWFVHGDVGDCLAPLGAHGPEAVMRLARHFRERGQELAAYAQADDIWSIARHRAFLCRHAETVGDAQAETWLREHGVPLAKRWGHMAPLMMQAALALGAGRRASSSVADTLDELAERERAAAGALPEALGACSIVQGDRFGS